MKVAVKTLVLAVLILAIGFWWFLSYHKSEFRGDGSISDTGVFTYPPYHVKLGTLALCSSHSVELEIRLHYPHRFLNPDYRVFDCGGVALSEDKLNLDWESDRPGLLGTTASWTRVEALVVRGQAAFPEKQKQIPRTASRARRNAAGKARTRDSARDDNSSVSEAEGDAARFLRQGN